MDKPKKLILDYSKWRCGYNSEVNISPKQLGEGSVRLLNNKGYMCCVGQWSLQCGASESELQNSAYPGSLNMLLPPFNKECKFGDYEDTLLTSDCIKINDDIETTPEEKIKLLTARLDQEGIELEVINKPL